MSYRSREKPAKTWLEHSVYGTCCLSAVRSALPVLVCFCLSFCPSPVAPDFSTCVCLPASACLRASACMSLSVCLSVQVQFHQGSPLASLRVQLPLPVCPCLCLPSVGPVVSLPVCLSVSVQVQLSLCLSVCLASACLSPSASACQSAGRLYLPLPESSLPASLRIQLLRLSLPASVRARLLQSSLPASLPHLSLSTAAVSVPAYRYMSASVCLPLPLSSPVVPSSLHAFVSSQVQPVVCFPSYMSVSGAANVSTRLCRSSAALVLCAGPESTESLSRAQKNLHSGPIQCQTQRKTFHEQNLKVS